MVGTSGAVALRCGWAMPSARILPSRAKRIEVALSNSALMWPAIRSVIAGALPR